MIYLGGMQIPKACPGPGSAAKGTESRAIQSTGNVTWPKGHIWGHIAWELAGHKVTNGTLVENRSERNIGSIDA